MAILSNGGLCTNGKVGNRRLVQLERTLQILEIVASRRFPITRNEVLRELSQMSGRWSERTIRRDLDLLAFLGLVQATQRPDRETAFSLGVVRNLARALRQVQYTA